MSVPSSSARWRSIGSSVSCAMAPPRCGEYSRLARDESSGVHADSSCHLPARLSTRARRKRKSGGASGTSSPTDLNSSKLRGVKPRARGWGELPACRSTTMVGTPRAAQNTAADSPTKLPPTKITDVASMSYLPFAGARLAGRDRSRRAQNARDQHRERPRQALGAAATEQVVASGGDQRIELGRHGRDRALGRQQRVSAVLALALLGRDGGDVQGQQITGPSRHAALDAAFFQNAQQGLEDAQRVRPDRDRLHRQPSEAGRAHQNEQVSREQLTEALTPAQLGRGLGLHGRERVIANQSLELLQALDVRIE